MWKRYAWAAVAVLMPLSLLAVLLLLTPGSERAKDDTRDSAQAVPEGNATASPAPHERPPVAPEVAQNVLDRMIGTWDWESTTYAGAQENRATGRNTFTRTLGGRFVRETGGDSDNKNAILGLYAYDTNRKCYRCWGFGSEFGGPQEPLNGVWNGAARTLDWTSSSEQGYALTIQHRFPGDDTIECSILGKEASGNTVFRAEYRMRRFKGAQVSDEPAADYGPPSDGQSPEQKILDQLLGNWSQEAILFPAVWTPEEKHISGTYAFVRILGGTFVQQTGVDSNGDSYLILYTYDAKRGCFRTWNFGSNYDGPDASLDGAWNEAARTIEFSGKGIDGHPIVTGRMHFESEGRVLSSVTIKELDGVLMMHEEFIMTRFAAPPAAGAQGAAAVVPAAQAGAGTLPEPNPNAPNMTMQDFIGTTWEVNPTSYGPVHVEFLDNGRANVTSTTLNMTLGGTWLVNDNQLFTRLDGSSERTNQVAIQGNTLTAPGVTIRRIR